MARKAQKDHPLDATAAIRILHIVLGEHVREDAARLQAPEDLDIGLSSASVR
jgi:hypothetical protein